MKNLPIEVRNKAIEIANALLAESNMKEGAIIATAIKRARLWAEKRGYDDDSKGQIENDWIVQIHKRSNIPQMIFEKVKAKWL